MDKHQSDDTFLARWVAGELSPEELAEFEKSEAFEEFDRINQQALRLEAPPIDKVKSLIAINEKITFGKRRKSILNFAIAASVTAILAVSALLFSTRTYTTAIGEQLVVDLPDGSRVRLNANTELSHKRFFWNSNKRVSLAGEAYFEVEKGDGFQVETVYGTTSVLGTKFNVTARPKRFRLSCFEGKVRFDYIKTTEQRILTEKQSITLKDDKIIDQAEEDSLPAWMQGFSIFKNEPFYMVLEELQAQFEIEFKLDDIDLAKPFSGAFFHDDLERALKSTLTPMGIAYELDEEGKTIILQ